MGDTWTHAICRTCWITQQPGRIPVTLKAANPVKCCFCERPTDEGIFLRADPEKTKCKGDHFRGR